MNFNDEIVITFVGEAGQGIDSLSKLFAKILKNAGYNIFETKEYMSRIKGGSNSATIRVSKHKVKAYKESIDVLFCISKEGLYHISNRLNENSFVLYEYEDLDIINNYSNKERIEFSSMAKSIGEKIYINSIVLGIGACLFKLDFEFVKHFIQDQFKDQTLDKNIQAFEQGYSIGNYIKEKINININTSESLKDEILMNASDALALGFVAGGIDFVASYPMSPSTGIFTFMAKNSANFNIIVEQAEDEISAINMGIGAWYAGGRALTTTSGGGFSLMCEAVSLAGMTETPMVIYLSQRPGPATGLPTRTEQGDLNLALYSGHGEFPRIIFSPTNLNDCFVLGKQACTLADKYQVPVFVLLDQYSVDSSYNITPFGLDDIVTNDYIVETQPDYLRYKLKDDGISPRGIPAYGNGLVIVDSDEHDEKGHITESSEVREKMVIKRMRKLEQLKNDFFRPDFLGSKDAKNIVICWGSTSELIKEAICTINNDELAMISFKQVYPLNNEVKNYFENALNVICIENNYSGQFANLLTLEFGVNIHHRILKYNGSSFSVEELVKKISEVLK